MNKSGKHYEVNQTDKLEFAKECCNMKNKRLWWLLLAIGIIPFVAPFIGFAYEMLISSSWTLADWLVMYSFVYWPTYILGFALIAISANKLIK